MRHLSPLFAVLFPLLGACAAAPPALPLLPRGEAPKPEVTLVWVGRGEAERLDDGVWRRVPALDYEFTVEQRRYRDRWESIKHLHRRHPDYDGAAGPRDQTMSFAVRLRPGGAAGGQDAVRLELTSTLGDGVGRSDSAFRESALAIRAAVSRFAPFDHYLLTQRYDYEGGKLDEVVTLARGEGPTASPWVRNREHALLYRAAPYAAPPTTFP